MSTLQVIYTYDSLEGMKKAAACDCTANVQKATQEAQAACAKQYGAPVMDGGALQEPAGVQMPTTTTTPNAECRLRTRLRPQRRRSRLQCWRRPLRRSR